MEYLFAIAWVILGLFIVSQAWKLMRASFSKTGLVLFWVVHIAATLILASMIIAQSAHPWLYCIALFAGVVIGDLTPPKEHNPST